MMKPKEAGPVRAKWWISDVGYRIGPMGLSPQNLGLAISPGFEGEDTDHLVELESKYVDVPLWLTINADPDENDTEHLSITYDPLEVPNLHRKFAGLAASRNGIVKFANEFGFLGRRTESMVPYESGRTEDDYVEDEPRVWGENVEDWTLHVARLRALLELWDLFRDPAPKALERIQFMLELSTETVCLSDAWAHELCAMADDARQVWRSGVIDHTSDIADIPFLDLEDWIQLEADISELSPLLDNSSRLRLAARILIREAVNEELRDGSYASIDVKEGSPIYLVPRDLLGAMYVMFARELVGASVPAIQCQGCGTYFIPQHGRQRYCDDRCKFKGYRQRKKEAKNG